MKTKILGLLTVGLLAGPMSAQAVVIDFDDLWDGTVITTQYSGVAFSSPTGVNYVTTQPAYNSTPPNFLCTGPVGGGIDCMQETIVTFASGVYGLTFDGLGINNVGLVALVDVFVGGVLSFTHSVIGNAELYDPVLVDLSAASNVSSIRIYNITDSGGIGWDTFHFEFSAPVPEPGTLALFGLGLAGLGLSRRRKTH